MTTPQYPPPWEPGWESVRRLTVGKRDWMGRPREMKTPEQLWQAFLDYEKDVTDNPLKEEKVFCSNGKIVRASIPKMRAMTIKGFILHAGFYPELWFKWKASRPDLREAQDRIETAIYNQKFTGAAAGLLSPHFIGRALGLADKVEVQQTPLPAPAPPEKVADLIHPDCTDEQLEMIYAAGKQPVLYTQEQLEAGLPHILPSGLP